MKHLIGTYVIVVHGLQLAIDLLPEFLCVCGREEAGHDGSGDDQVAAPVNPLHRVATGPRAGPCTPGDVPDGSAPDVALVSESQRPVELVSLEPPSVHVPVVLVVLVSFGQIGVELRDEAGHEDPRIISQEVIAPVVLMYRIRSIPLGLPVCTIVSLKMEVSFRSSRGGHVGKKRNQVVFTVRLYSSTKLPSVRINFRIDSEIVSSLNSITPLSSISELNCQIHHLFEEELKKSRYLNKISPPPQNSFQQREHPKQQWWSQWWRIH